MLRFPKQAGGCQHYPRLAACGFDLIAIGPQQCKRWRVKVFALQYRHIAQAQNMLQLAFVT